MQEKSREKTDDFEEEVGEFECWVQNL